MDAEPLSMLLVGHSFIRRLADYALVSGTMNLGLNEGDCQFLCSRGVDAKKAYAVDGRSFVTPA